MYLGTMGVHGRSAHLRWPTGRRLRRTGVPWFVPFVRRGVALTAVVHLVGVGDAGDAGPVVVMGTLSP